MITASILGIVGSVLGFIFWYWKRRAGKLDNRTPLERYHDEQVALEKLYHERNEKAIAVDLDDTLDHIERMQESRKSVDGGK